MQRKPLKFVTLGKNSTDILKTTFMALLSNFMSAFLVDGLLDSLLCVLRLWLMGYSIEIVDLFLLSILLVFIYLTIFFTCDPWHMLISYFIPSKTNWNVLITPTTRKISYFIITPSKTKWNVLITRTTRQKLY